MRIWGGVVSIGEEACALVHGRKKGGVEEDAEMGARDRRSAQGESLLKVGNVDIHESAAYLRRATCPS